MGVIRSGKDDACAGRAVTDVVLRPGSLFAVPDIDAVINAGQLLMAGRHAAVDQSNLDSAAAAFRRKLFEPHRLTAPMQRLRQRQGFQSKRIQGVGAKLRPMPPEPPMTGPRFTEQPPD